MIARAVARVPRMVAKVLRCGLLGCCYVVARVLMGGC